MKSGLHFLGLAVVFPLLCGGAFAGLYVILVALCIPQLPLWAQGGVTDWLLGTPQPPSWVDPVRGSAPAGPGVDWAGYTDPVDASPPHGLPLAGSPALGCLFGDPNYRDHTGVDFPVGQGVTIYAPMAGKVVWASWKGPWGNLVVIENNGYQVWLAHMVTFSVVEGQILAYGGVVGATGTTGNSTGPHLHYGIRQQTEAGVVWLNPLAFFGPAEYIKVECK